MINPRAAQDMPATRANGATTPRPAAPARRRCPDALCGWKPTGRALPQLFGDDSYTNDDVGNGRRFIAVWGDDVAWVPDEKRTYTWTGQRWEHDTGAQMRHLAERLTDYMLTEALLRLRPAQQRYDAVVNRGDDDPAKVAAAAALAAAKADVKWAQSSRMDKALKACVTSASSHPRLSIRPGEWDADAWLLNVGNGTLRLELDGSHTFDDTFRREDRITQQAVVHYDPDAVAPLFLAALEVATRPEGAPARAGYRRDRPAGQQQSPQVPRVHREGASGQDHAGRDHRRDARQPSRARGGLLRLVQARRHAPAPPGL